MSWQGPTQVLLRAVLAAAALACALIAPAAAGAAEPPPGSEWSKHKIQSAGGVTLHADVLRPAGIPADQKTPVILSIGPYFNHSGQLGPIGAVEGAPYDPVNGGPSDRFYDFINGAKVFERGYTWVQVDLRGFGGSGGCLDWGGPGEQADVVAAVEWAASQPWSTGKVGMYGKSYDAVTGLIGIARQPRGLAAVIAQEPVYDLYRYLYMNRVRFPNSLLTPALYNAIAASPGSAGDELAYNFESLNDTARPGCPALNYADQQDRNHESEYWKQRDFIEPMKGKRTPLFMTQGFIEYNTKPDGAFDLYNNHEGPKRAWFGMFDHVRGNDRDEDGRLLMGREGWFEESMRFYDRYVAGKSAAEAPTEKDPPNAVQDNTGTWRSEASWPPADSFTADAPLKPGSYTDDATNNGTADTFPPGPTGVGVWTFSPKFDLEVRFAGVPRLTVDVDSGPEANLTAAIYDIDDKNRATLISRGTYLLGGSGRVAFDLYGNDWKLPAGHRFGVLISSSHAEWWAHAPTGQNVTVKAASMRMPYLSCQRRQTIQGTTNPKLEAYLENTPFEVDPETISEQTDANFPLPGALERCAAGLSPTQGGERPGCVDRRKFSFRIHQPRRGRIVKAVAYVNGKRKVQKKAKGRRGKVTRLTVKRLPKRVFTLKIVALHSSKKRTVSVRRYRGCRKGRPTTTVRGPRRGR